MTETTEAKDFYKLLQEKILSCRGLKEKDGGIIYKEGDGYKICSLPDCKRMLKDEKICVGKKVMGYLNHAIPEWQKMNNGRLYKQIKSMHENAEKIRRFEIELVWKRLVYVIGIMFPFFASFGAIALSAENFNFSNNKILAALFFIAFINTLLSVYFLTMVIQNYRWQLNWEINVDFLEEILGINLMRTWIQRRPKSLTIPTVNKRIGILLTLIWTCLSALSLGHLFSDTSVATIMEWFFFPSVVGVAILAIEIIARGLLSKIEQCKCKYKDIPYKRKLKDLDFPVLDKN